MKFKLSLLCLLALAVACSPDADERLEERFVGQTTPIINGDPPNAARHGAVVELFFRSGNSATSGFCSGTLISPSVVLTAAHCLDVGNGIAMSPSSLAVYFGNNSRTDSSPDFRTVAETTIHPNYGSSQIINDVGLIRLTAPHPTATPVPALPANRGFTSTDLGSLTLNFAGFGVDEFGSSDVKLQTNGILGGFGCSVSGCSSSPSSTERATQIAYTQRTSGVCNGDSGGPAFVNRNGTYYVGGVTSYGDFNCTQFGVSTRADAYENFIQSFIGVDPGPDPGPDPDPGGGLQRFEQTDLSGSRGQEIRFEVDVPAGAQDLKFAIFGGSGDADLYTRFGQPPSTESFDCRPYRSGNVEDCSVDSPRAGTYYIMVRAWSDFSGATLVVEYDGPAGGGNPGGGSAPDFPVDVVVDSIPQGQSTVGDFDVPAGFSQLVFQISGGTGDADLYVQRGSAPTTASYDCRPYTSGNAEECTFDNPIAGTYHVMVRGYRDSANVRFQASLQ